MTKIFLKKPQIEGNRIYLSWEPNVLFNGSGYWVQYLNLNNIDVCPQGLLEAYLPVCLAFCALGDVEINFPYPFDPHVLKSWEKVLRDTSRRLFKRKFGVRFNNLGPEEGSHSENSAHETGLLLGGGSESLLTLAYLLDKGISPYLISLWGSHWPGSDLELNRDRYNMEEKLSNEFSLKMFRITTNFRDLLEGCQLRSYLSREVYFLNSVLFLPLNLSLLYPVAQQIGLKRIVSGHEKENSIGYYSLSPEMTHNLRTCSWFVEYAPFLEDLRKIDIVKNLHLSYPGIGKYQTSCWRAKNERWCLKCEKCLRNYSIFKIYGINPVDIGMDEHTMKQNLATLMSSAGWEIAQNDALRQEWGPIRDEAKKRHCTEVTHIISQIFKRYPLRKMIATCRSWYR